MTICPGFHCQVCRSLNEKIFPILSVTEMTGSFYNNFVTGAGFAILASYDQKLVRTSFIFLFLLFTLLVWELLTFMY